LFFIVTLAGNTGISQIDSVQQSSTYAPKFPEPSQFPIPQQQLFDYQEEEKVILQPSSAIQQQTTTSVGVSSSYTTSTSQQSFPSPITLSQTQTAPLVSTTSTAGGVNVHPSSAAPPSSVSNMPPMPSAGTPPVSSSQPISSQPTNTQQQHQQNGSAGAVAQVSVVLILNF
uniref:Cell wall protein DAN4 n=1 Tax=Anisakis simplex TaxID=6269 RepID=A0A0M3JG59_ANISI